MTVTNKQIYALRDEAIEHGDHVMEALCDIALASALGKIPDINEEIRSDLERLGVYECDVRNRDIARARCAEILNARNKS